jgi:hypothetical protein
MADPHPAADSKERVANYVYFASLYFVSVGVLYLWGYWSPFGVNILEHLALTDVIKITAYPVVTALLLSAVGAAIGEALVGEARLPAGGGRDTRVGRFLHRFAQPLLVLYVVGTFALLVIGPIEKWRVLPLLLGLPLYVAAKQAGLLQSLIPHESPRSIVLYVLATLPPLAYGHGLLAANKIQTGLSFKYLLPEIPQHAAEVEPTRALRYVGIAGEVVFFFDPARTAGVLTKVEQGSPIVLKQFELPKSPAASSSSPGAAPASAPAGPNHSPKRSANGGPGALPPSSA